MYAYISANFCQKICLALCQHSVVIQHRHANILLAQHVLTHANKHNPYLHHAFYIGLIMPLENLACSDSWLVFLCVGFIVPSKLVQTRNVNWYCLLNDGIPHSVAVSTLLGTDVMSVYLIAFTQCFLTCLNMMLFSFHL